MNGTQESRSVRGEPVEPRERCASVLRQAQDERGWERDWGGLGMIKKTLLAGLLACAATPALAQGGPPPSPYAPLQDRPTCTRDELKAASAAYVEAQRKGDISG